MKTIQIHLKVPSGEYCWNWNAPDVESCEHLDQEWYECRIFESPNPSDEDGILKCKECTEAGEV